MKTWSKKKRLLISAGVGLAIFLIIIGGLGSCYVQSRELPKLTYAFASDRSGAGDIFVLDQAGQLQNLTEHPASDWDPTWSPDGQLLAFTSHRSQDSDIWLLDLAGPEGQDQPHNLTHHPAWDYSPSWSPSGQSLAFVSERDGDPEIFVQNLQEEMAIQLTFNETMDRLPAWSPDGQYIAFAAVRDGNEKIYLIRPDGTDETLIIPHALQGTFPAWSPDSKKLAFIGWDETGLTGIYTISPETQNPAPLYQSQAWLGSLSWSADGEWLTFTSWEAGNHEVYALSTTAGAAPVRITFDEAWDDSLVINPATKFSATPPEGIAQAAGAQEAVPVPGFAGGVNMADLSLAYLVSDLGLGWAKSYVNWETVEPEPGQFRWVDPDNIVKAFGQQKIKILMRVHGTPAWARPADTHLSHPPEQVADFANFMTALASRYKGQVAAYEIWNEPNLNYEWGYRQPDPAAYTDLLKAAYTAVKAVDPEALIISGGLSTTGEGSPTAYGDLKFIQGMYDAGAKGYFDALGSHPYPYGLAPDALHPDGLSLARVVEQYQVMQANNDDETPIWITETGWVLSQAYWDLGEHQHFGVTEIQQGHYLAQTYANVRRDWPFVQAVFLFNLDFSTVSWYPADEPMRWYSIMNPDRTPRPAYTQLRQLMRSKE